MTDELRERARPVQNLLKDILNARRELVTQGKRSEAARTRDTNLADKEEERARFLELVEQQGLNDPGVNPTGMYELCGKLIIFDLGS